MSTDDQTSAIYVVFLGLIQPRPPWAGVPNPKERLRKNGEVVSTNNICGTLPKDFSDPTSNHSCGGGDWEIPNLNSLVYKNRISNGGYATMNRLVFDFSSWLTNFQRHRRGCQRDPSMLDMKT